MSFTPGSQHTARVALRNSGTAPATLSQGIQLTISPDVGVLVTAQGAVIAPGGQGDWTIPFTISPAAQPGRQNTWSLSVPYDGLTLTGSGDAFMVEAGALGPFYAVDTWEQTAPDTKNRYEDVACGWNAGPVRVDAHFLFGTIPTNINQALLRFFLRTGFGPQPFGTELRDPYVGLLGTENNSPPATITLDVTAAVKTRGTLWVVINPAFWLGVVQFKYFGGIFDGDPAKTYWPRIEVS